MRFAVALSISGKPSRNTAQPKGLVSEAAEFKYFNQLPAELVLEVARWLPVSASAALALCNHKSLALLGKSEFRDLKLSDTKYNLDLG